MVPVDFPLLVEVRGSGPWWLFTFTVGTVVDPVCSPLSLVVISGPMGSLLSLHLISGRMWLRNVTRGMVVDWVVPYSQER